MPTPSLGPSSGVVLYGLWFAARAWEYLGQLAEMQLNIMAEVHSLSVELQDLAAEPGEYLDNEEGARIMLEIMVWDVLLENVAEMQADLDSKLYAIEAEARRYLNQRG
ncbi:hypothetical protein QBC32DRAFT_332003 [Pseudoneurospora amorphoporcata]|uniref:Uncharacterized protein n=1 Tax=Pseudoneurospora amorphoporcata TaxID=241081 RepID=A0AAN6P1R0_9PEZI|nr:hypothetical protein QBC32DRAFT_332003 [Pseudoneurospora amorphoporcata]